MWPFSFLWQFWRRNNKKILSGKFKFDDKYFKNISNEAKDLISKCLIYDKNKRISIEDILKHEFVDEDLNQNNIFEDQMDSKNALISKINQIVLAYFSNNFPYKK